MRRLKILILTILFSSTLFGQISDNYSDKLLSTSFKAYGAVDSRFGYAMYPFIKERFLEHLKDSSSFSNPYDSLSKYIDIRHSLDGLAKTYSWRVRDSGCCYASETYLQYKTESGAIKYVDLKKIGNEGGDIFITDLQMIKIKSKPYYLILGWGTCCGGKHYTTVKVYEIKDGSLHKSKSIFNGEDDIYIGANRGQKMELKYLPEEKILSYNSYKLKEEIGFYEREKKLVKWKLTKQGFKKMK
ncbi:hypothetical protein [Aquimarina longa]|uniref:hypothetical protein n=1 Tax=Aquimarina longa TaxID=1080221 RepID=UPI0011DFFB3F|nr:hypothetical protein [Aquimarina longa]